MNFIFILLWWKKLFNFNLFIFVFVSVIFFSVLLELIVNVFFLFGEVVIL